MASQTQPGVGIDITRATKTTDEVDARIDDMFEYHAWDENKMLDGKVVREALADAVRVIIDHVPPSEDRTAAIRKIREARMDCNSAITHDGRY